MDVSAIVLAGGKGSRLGYNKIQVTIGERTLFERVLYSLSFIQGDIIIVTSGKEPLPGLTRGPKYRVVADIYPGKGPLVGVLTGLKASRSDYNLTVASDMPFLNRTLLGYMIELAPGFDSVVPRLDGLVEPLHAVYARSCLKSVESLIEQGDYSVNSLLDLVRVRYVEKDEIDRFDPRHLSFFNVNTQADLEVSREIVSRGDPLQ